MTDATRIKRRIKERERALKRALRRKKRAPDALCALITDAAIEAIKDQIAALKSKLEATE